MINSGGALVALIGAIFGVAAVTGTAAGILIANKRNAESRALQEALALNRGLNQDLKTALEESTGKEAECVRKVEDLRAAVTVLTDENYRLREAIEKKVVNRAKRK